MKRLSCLWVLVLVAAGVCTSSCVARVRSVPVRPEKVAVPEMAPLPLVPAPPQPDMQARAVREPEDAMLGRALLDRRLGFYQARLAGWQVVERQLTDLGLADRPAGWGRCLDEVGELRDQYEMASRQAGQENQDQEDGAPGQRGGELFDRDISYLGSGCDAILALGTASFAVRSAPPPTEASAQTASLPAASLLPEARQQFGLALLQAGQFEAAANVLAGEESGELLSDEDVTRLRLTADLLLAVGRVAEASGRYERLDRYGNALHGVERWVAEQLELLRDADAQSPDFPGFLAVLRAYLLFDGRQVSGELRQGVARLEEQAPASVLAKRGRRLLEMAEEKSGEWLPARLTEVDALIEAREFARALAVLDGLAAREDMDRDQQAMVHEALVKARQAKFLAEETQETSPEQEAGSAWENGLQLLDAGKYDEAIAIFTALLETGYQSQAREKLGEASDLAIKQTRGQASALFVQARQTASQERKKTVLMESWKLLKGAESRYPGATSTMLEKVRQNLGYLEDYIRQVDPALLDTAR